MSCTNDKPCKLPALRWKHSDHCMAAVKLDEARKLLERLKAAWYSAKLPTDEEEAEQAAVKWLRNNP